MIFASYNIHKCVGGDRRFDPDRTAEVIAEIGADVLALQEADRRFGDRAGLLDLAAITRRTGLRPVELPARMGGHGWRGNVLLVRDGLVRDVRTIALPGIEPRGAVLADLDVAGGSVRVVAAHLGLLRQSRLLQIKALLTAVEREAEHPAVLLGDFNEWRRARRSALHGLAPAFGPVGGDAKSFPAWLPMLALDRILARPDGLLGPVAAHDTPLARLASDHLPVKARLMIGPTAHAPLPESPDSPRRRGLGALIERRGTATGRRRP